MTKDKKKKTKLYKQLHLYLDPENPRDQKIIEDLEAIRRRSPELTTSSVFLRKIVHFFIEGHADLLKG